MSKNTSSERVNIRKHDDGLKFGLWSSCPTDVPVAWGARAILDPRFGVSLLPDRQSWTGPPGLRKRFSDLLRSGPLDRAMLEAKRLRFGWTPFQDLDEELFIGYWHARMKSDPNLFESFSASSGGDVDVSPGYPFNKQPKDWRPKAVFRSCKNEQKEYEEYALMLDESDSEDRFIPPDPPSCCEDEDEAEDDEEGCGNEFKKVGGKWVGCYLDDDAWVCESCGHHHCFDWEDGEDTDPPPPAPIQKAFRKIVGIQPARMHDDKSELFKLYDDDTIVILGNTNASFGYLYLIAYPKHDIVDEENLVDTHPGFDGSKSLLEPGKVVWSGCRPIPQPGDRVRLLAEGVGASAIESERGLATVIAHRVIHDHLHIITVPHGPLPEWWSTQNRNKYVPLSKSWNALGREIGEEIIRANEP